MFDVGFQIPESTGVHAEFASAQLIRSLPFSQPFGSPIYLVNSHWLGSFPTGLADRFVGDL